VPKGCPRGPGKEKVAINGASMINAHGIGARGMRMIGPRAITKGPEPLVAEPHDLPADDPLDVEQAHERAGRRGPVARDAEMRHEDEPRRRQCKLAR